MDPPERAPSPQQPDSNTHQANGGLSFLPFPQAAPRTEALGHRPLLGESEALGGSFRPLDFQITVLRATEAHGITSGGHLFICIYFACKVMVGGALWAHRPKFQSLLHTYQLWALGKSLSLPELPTSPPPKS